MKPKRLKPFIIICCLIAVSGIAMAYSGHFISLGSGPGTGMGTIIPGASGVVSLSGHLSQNKVLQGSDGTVTLSLDMTAEDILDTAAGDTRNADMIIVMDRSGSMKGRKIRDAKQAVLRLLAGLTPKDRFALIAYSDGVQKYSGLTRVTDESRAFHLSAINGMRAGGGTNLGAGLKAGIETLKTASRTGNASRIILISDGLANKGITDSHVLGKIASIAAEKEFSISTVGVGAEFNEILMTRIADQGTGNYYYLENPAAFVEVFQKEFLVAQTTAATSVAVWVPLSNGLTLTDASGYPVTIRNGHAVFHPGSLRSGQTRKIFLTFRVPTHRAGNIDIHGIHVRYNHDDRKFVSRLLKPLKIACVKNKKAVFSSIDKKVWEEKVLKDDYNRLKQEVASDIKMGDEKKAMDRILKYQKENEAVNAQVGSGEVARRLDRDLGKIKTMVTETFQGSPSAVSQKQKLNSKALQYEGYRGRRSRQ
jgi:Ca-activated chloride channel family protein